LTPEDGKRKRIRTIIRDLVCFYVITHHNLDLIRLTWKLDRDLEKATAALLFLLSLNLFTIGGLFDWLGFGSLCNKEGSVSFVTRICGSRLRD
jgi:hypothetical protein